MGAILDIQNLTTYFNTYRGVVKAVDGVSLCVHEKETIGVVGESGCGKSVTMLSAMQLIPVPPGRIVHGKVIFDGHDLLRYEARGDAMTAVRGAKIAMVFQEPMTSLNPVLTIGRQLTEALETHLAMDRRQARERAVDLLALVGIPDGARRMNDYPHQFSGGMRQRIMIAIALSCSPRIVIADEPTTALDVTTQAQLLELMTETVDRIGTSLVIVTHNLGIVARHTSRIYVMYSGRVVESGPAEEIFERPRHPYTIGLLNCVPRLGESRQKRKLIPIVGLPPNLINMPPTCAFLPRCSVRTGRCAREPWPALAERGPDHYSACFLGG
jgi:oligopeptide/dipeptide ABC transporter ATP-binding protein